MSHPLPPAPSRSTSCLPTHAPTHACLRAHAHMDALTRGVTGSLAVAAPALRTLNSWFDYTHAQTLSASARLCTRVCSSGTVMHY